MIDLIVATRNKKKFAEIKGLLSDMDIRVSSLADYPDMPSIEEDGRTFAANAIKKAATIALYTKKLVMGEDSGLQVKALGNRPGVYSSRFAGEKASDKKNNEKLLRLMRNIPLSQRQARYQCYVALVDGNGIVGVVNGSCSGLIVRRSKGKNGFGYDPLFYIPRYKKTFGELDLAIKAKISHRARALKKFKMMLKEYLRKKKSSML